MFIYTLDFIREQAKDIASHWDGKKVGFVDGNGTPRTESDAHVANNLLNTLDEVEQMLKDLNI